MCHVRHDAMWDSILSRPLPRRIKVESAHLRVLVRRDSIRSVRLRRAHHARIASPNSLLHTRSENIGVCLNCLCARAKLDLPADALAQFLAGYSIAA
jgi:hypothetical protein